VKSNQRPYLFRKQVRTIAVADGAYAAKTQEKSIEQSQFEFALEQAVNTHRFRQQSIFFRKLL
jgi:hypothetical protein